MDGPGIIGAYMTKVNFQWDIARQPLGPANRASEVAVDAFEIVATTQHPDQAWRWLKFIAADRESVAQFVRATGRVPSLRALQARYPTLVTAAPRSWTVFFDTAADPGAFANYVIPRAADVNPIISRELGKVWRGEEPARGALEAIHREVEALLKQGAAQR